MPVINTREGTLPLNRRAALRDAIVNEIRRASDTPRPAGAPVVVREETVGSPRYAHWFVVWERFKNVDSENRASVIMDAVEAAFGREEVLRTTSVLGLTPDDPLVGDLRLLSLVRQPAAVREKKAVYRTRPPRAKA